MSDMVRAKVDNMRHDHCTTIRFPISVSYFRHFSEFITIGKTGKDGLRTVGKRTSLCVRNGSIPHKTLKVLQEHEDFFNTPTQSSRPWSALRASRQIGPRGSLER